MAKNEKLTDLIRRIKFEEKLTQSEIANRIGVNSQYLSGVINGHYPFSSELENKLYEKFSDLFQTTLSDPIQPYHTTPRPIPYYPVDFEGGFDLMINDQTATPERLVTFPNQPQRATCCCHITGHSMEPELNNGDIIVLEHIPDFSWLPLGEIYAIVTTNGMRTVKRLMRATDDTCYRLHPANTNYPDQDIPKNILQHVFRVVGSYKNL